MMRYGNPLWSILERVATVSMIVASGVVIWVGFGIRGSMNDVRSAAGAGRRNVPPEPTMKEFELPPDATAIGSIEAKRAVIEFNDFECPFCARFVHDTFAGIKREFVDNGKVRYIFRNFPLEKIHSAAFGAGTSAECANAQGKYLEMRTLLFQNQRRLAERDLVGYASLLRLEEGRFKECLQGEMDERVRSDVAEGLRLGVHGTPTFFVGDIGADGRIKVFRKLTGAVSLEAFRAALDTASVSSESWGWLDSMKRYVGSNFFSSS